MSPPTEVYRRRTGSETKAEIEKVALALFTRNGYEATTMREIAEQLQITKPALYYHFSSKEEIIRTLFEEHLATWDEIISWAASQPASPDLRREVLTRWANATRHRRMELIRLAVANQESIKALAPLRTGMASRLTELVTILIGPEASVRDRIRARMAVLSVNIAVMTGQELGAEEGDILDIALEVALRVLPDLDDVPAQPVARPAGRPDG
ncbi:TetR/AcrR family transcriptional regulator [Actinomadura chibensis]|uniref:TetR/AcrR family transcriptional regulator n=1 Tax=Actinomadura chibensis TaxID=392828 RepID=A0A5D0NLM2_9ACTN|nr:TetR/AcrR family transcriptional regulator [Actinomadura chibensis]TYB45383.1 TetR/AcrR family transcriptional regulator [Actinomadura chibensis]